MDGEDTTVSKVGSLGSSSTTVNTVEEDLAHAIAEDVADQVGVSPAAMNTESSAFNAIHWVGSDWCRYYA